MANGINKVILVGHLGNDPEVRYAQSGAAITTISVATTETWKDKDGNKQERTEWHRVKAFGRLAEIMGEYLTKGRQVYVEGSLRTEKYTDKNGVEKYSTDVIADEMRMLGSSGESSGVSQRSERPARQGDRPANSGRDERPPSAERSDRGGERSYGQRSGGPPRNDDPFPDDDIPF